MRTIFTARHTLLIAAWALVVALSPWARAEQNPLGAPLIRTVTLDVFVRSDSKHSQDAEAFARRLEQQRTGLHVVVHDVLEDADARSAFWELSKKFQGKKPGLPAFFACNRVGFGFASAETSGPAVEELFTIHAFVRQGCPHCRDAKTFLAGLARRWPAMRIELHDVIADPAAQSRMTALAQRYGVHVASLPAIEICGRFVVGYDHDATSGRRLETILSEAAEPMRGLPKPVAPPNDAQGESDKKTSRARSGAHPNAIAAALVGFVTAGDEPPLPPVAEEDTQVLESTEAAPPPQGIELRGWGMLRVGDLGLPLFTFVIGLVDGFNPCAMWVLVFLLSILVNVRSRSRILAIAGTFVVVSGLAYYAFMAAWLNVFLLVGYLRPLQITLGLLAIFIGLVNLKDFVAFKKGLSLSIPESAKAGIYERVRKIVTAKYLTVAVGLAVVLAVGVNVVELLCTAGLPALYTQILTLQELPAWQNYAYLAIYILAYMLDDTLMLSAFVITLSHRKLQEREGRWLKAISGLVILVLGLVMLLRPDWLQLSSAVR